MKLAEWSEIQMLYKRSRRQPNKLLFTRMNASRLWPMWMAFASTFLLVGFVLWTMKNPILILYSYIALLPWGLALFLTRLKGLHTVYPQEFDEHAIATQSILNRENILCYAFFLNILRAEEYTAEKAREMSDYSELVGKPTKPALSQNIGFASLVALMITLSAEIIKGAGFITSMGLAVVMLGFAALFIYWVVLDGIHSVAYEKALIKRYLDLAVWDLAPPSN